MILKIYLLTFLLSVTSIGLTGCVDSARSGKRNFGESNNSESTINTALNCQGGVPVSADNPCINALDAQPEVELTHFINPYDGSYTRKLTLPKNYDGNLYISGLNIGTLTDRNIRVRFTFGVNRTPIVLEATVGKGQGATGSVLVDVLIIDLKQLDFRTLQLFYSLFDYNNYDMDATLGADSQVVQDNRDPGLYCRGLNLEDDPTYTGAPCSAQSTGIEGACVYAYAQIGDQSLHRRVTSGSGNFFYNPVSSAQQSVENATPYFAHQNANILKRCLPDADPGTPIIPNGGNPSFSISNPAELYKFSDTITFPDFNNITTIDGVDYRYSGPFRQINKSSWALPSGLETALFGKFGLFRRTYAQPSDDLDTKLNRGVVANLFPRFTKYDISPNIDHLASSNSNAPGSGREVRSLNLSGETNWMDGCNERVRSKNSSTQFNIGSCNVSAKIEILHQDFQLNKQILILESSDLKLQLVDDANYNDEGENVLASSFSTCSSNSECGSDSCCFNGRCWSDTIISQCIDETQSNGNRPVGATCSSDLQCSSLCCDQTSGRCNVHVDSGSDNPVLCNKQPGQSCIARPWCAQQVLPECYIVSTGSGATDCEYRCYNVERFGECINNSCQAPQARVDDSSIWNPSNPNRCDNARDPSVTPPSF